MSNDYDYTAPDWLLEKCNMNNEISRVLAALINGENTKSHCFYMMYSEDKPKGYWGVDRIDELLERFSVGEDNPPHLRLLVCTLWNDNPDVPFPHDDIPDESLLPSGTVAIIKNGTLVNMTDFIIACCQSCDTLENHMDDILYIMFSGDENISLDTCDAVSSSLLAIADRLEKPKYPHSREEDYLQELFRVMTQLLKGEADASSELLAVSLCDKPGGHWNAAHLQRLLALFGVSGLSHPDTLYISYLSVHKRTEPVPDYIANAAKGLPEALLARLVDVTIINLTDFIHDCCSSGEIMKHYQDEVTEIILYQAYPLATSETRKKVKDMLMAIAVTQALSGEHVTHA